MSVVFFTDRDLGLKFPKVLKDAGLSVERHVDHFAPDCPDTQWLTAIADRGWIAVTHDKRIRYKRNELAAVIDNKVALIVVIGDAPYPELAGAFVATASKITQFVAAHSPPYIAKMYRAERSRVEEERFRTRPN